MRRAQGMVKKNDRSTRRFDSFRNFNCFTFTYKILWVRRFTATGNHLQCFDTGGRDQRFKLLEVFHIFVLRKIDVYQYRLLTSIITVKQAYNPLNRSAGNAGSLAPRVKKTARNLIRFLRCPVARKYSARCYHDGSYCWYRHRRCYCDEKPGETGQQ